MLDTIAFDPPFDGETAHLGVPLFAATCGHDGPRLVVAGPEALVRPLAEQFWNVRGLEGMNGALILRDDTQDPVFDLPDAVLELERDVSVARAFFQVLGHMTALGMLAGRGVPLRRVA